MRRRREADDDEALSPRSQEQLSPVISRTKRQRPSAPSPFSCAQFSSSLPFSESTLLSLPKRVLDRIFSYITFRHRGVIRPVSIKFDHQVGLSLARVTAASAALLGKAWRDSRIAWLTQQCRGLTDIDMSNGEFLSDYGIKTVALQCPKLTRINLSGCKLVSGVGLRALAELCRHLRTVNISCTNVSAACQKVFRQLNPNVSLVSGGVPASVGSSVEKENTENSQPAQKRARYNLLDKRHEQAAPGVGSPGVVRVIRPDAGSF
jgi:hypothetical protein